MSIRFNTLFVLCLFSLFAFTACITFTHCSDDAPTGPAISSHEFTWEADTLWTAGGLTIETIWGTSRDNVYIGGETYELESGEFRWDGVKWNVIDETLKQRKNISTIDGTDSSYIVFAGMNQNVNPVLIVYDRGHWKTIALPQPLRYINTMKVVSRDELYIGGVDGILEYKQGNWKWLLDSTESKFDGSYSFWMGTMLYRHGTIYQFTSQRDWGANDEKMYLSQKTNAGYETIDSFLYVSDGSKDMRFGHWIHEAKDGLFSISAGGIYEFKNDRWELIHNKNGFQMTGSRNNMYAGRRNELFHYNGQSWKDITPLAVIGSKSNLWMDRMGYVDGVIFIANSVLTKYGYKTAIYRGYQK